MTLQVELVSPEQVLFEGDATWSSCAPSRRATSRSSPGTHRSSVRSRRGRSSSILEDGSRRLFAVHGGFVEVSHDRVMILSDVAELSEYIDVERAAEAKARCEEILARDPDDFVAQAALDRATTRLEVASRAN